MGWLIIKQKGFVYIITTVIIITFITMLFLLTRPQPSNYSNAQNIAQNYKFELNRLINNNLTVSDINNFNNSFYNFIRAHNYNAKMCLIISKNNNIYLSNFLGMDDSNVSDRNTIVEPKINQDYTLLNCELDSNSSHNLAYYIEIYNNSEKIIYKDK